MDTKTILSEASDRMQKTIEHLEEEQHFPSKALLLSSLVLLWS